MTVIVITSDVTIGLPRVYCLALVAVIHSALHYCHAHLLSDHAECLVFLNENYGLL